MTGRTITSKVSGYRTIPWAELKTFEFNTLKERGPGDVVKLKNAIVSDGFAFPIEVWAGHRYVIDGHGRDIALRQLEKEGYEIPEIPVIEIEAPTKEAAKRLVLMRSSIHGRITQASVDRFVEDIDTTNLDLVISIPGIDIGVAGSEIGDGDAIDDFESVDVDEEEDAMTCPQCGHRFMR